MDATDTGAYFRFGYRVGDAEAVDTYTGAPFQTNRQVISGPFVAFAG
jgi:hypothetical protein